MSILKILYYPDHRLRKYAHPVTSISIDTKKIIQDMFDTMYYNHGIGLSATQVNIHQQIVTIDICNTHQKRLVFINPSIIKKSGKISILEGCLSIPKIQAKIVRSKEIVVKFLDQNGFPLKMVADNLLSVCIQHEIDHLSGKLFIDYLSPLQIKKLLKNT